MAVVRTRTVTALAVAALLVGGAGGWFATRQSASDLRNAQCAEQTVGHAGAQPWSPGACGWAVSCIGPR